MPAATSGPAYGPPDPAPGTLRHPALPGGAAVRTVTLRYRDRAPAQVRGPATGRLYLFSVLQPTQAVDVRDAETLLRTRLFVRV
jgi:hypothetical protein